MLWEAGGKESGLWNQRLFIFHALGEPLAVWAGGGKETQDFGMGSTYLYADEDDLRLRREFRACGVMPRSWAARR